MSITAKFELNPLSVLSIITSKYPKLNGRKDERTGVWLEVAFHMFPVWRWTVIIPSSNPTGWMINMLFLKGDNYKTIQNNIT